ncbi:MAG TPA: bifunctional diaminohydroxyphosphoribosylaminopyrimidine deaminase/5-amino-6-(5-phosphoribosylamino)uracil reductase RibD [bacterium]|nr:bifunctional diaminohydroxyphosphoribosylaminopyrimidine deaminase/5-amino-6-(5-phosphoribosylamino)uracil reductase RibD [bacterium]HOL49255.1 bifunctional diaminohydroxyphosphoribosylaminopyrimidine deaminase/5-amino-6-(5-phosphoribosylamino)uracil reductase RibD [bacterium]HPO51324.1 bifunctional diaminohydroxyphosphoribosylaminopyrimidine deaminase/5-amino-6-(5-phosphoribosylamino)uracil reductase RibD [bacterium]HXK45108.1 bifunctional diaminohydroxyphosphoribosylaminopyrimidine deaminas
MKLSRDELFLKKCLSLAENGLGLVSPNPMVGAVIVKGSHIVGQGWHKAYGLPHAEVEALKMAGAKAKDAILYVNLEPCCHYGKTPPCTDAIIKAGIKKVVFCTLDPNPRVNGKTVVILKNHGIEVRYGLLENHAMELNESYFTYMKQKRPFITLKWAMSIDGKIADASGNSKWITSEDARKFNRNLRFQYDAIMVGAGTVIKDDPELDYSVPGGVRKSLLKNKRYTKIIIDGDLKCPPDTKMFLNNQGNVVVFTGKDTKPAWVKYPENVEFIEIDRTPAGFLDIRQVIKFLYDKGIGRLFVEGGTNTLTSFYDCGVFDKIYVFVGGKIIGGDAVYPPFKGGITPPIIDSNFRLGEIIRFSNDVLIVFKNVLRNN